jgi:hypothetical protein
MLRYFSEMLLENTDFPPSFANKFIKNPTM